MAKIKEQATGEPEPTTTMKRYDLFLAHIERKEVRNKFTRQNESIIVGWELIKKEYPRTIEPHNAVALNAFMAGSVGAGELIQVLCPVDTKKVGDKITYEEWAIDQGKTEEELKEDPNIFLTK
jgi:hypothetical protein